MWETYETAFNRTFPRGCAVEPARGGGVTITISCSAGHDCIEKFDVRMPPEKAKKHLVNKGYRFWGKKTKCPEHNRKKDKPVEIPKEVAAVAESDAQPSSNARAAKRQAMLWLDEVFDDKAGRYKEGHSDETVAKETVLSIQAVSKLRDEFGFDIKEPPEIAELRSRIAQAEERVRSIQSDASKLATSLLTEIGDIRSKLETMAKRNNW